MFRQAMSAEPVLFSYFRSSCSWRVRLALNIKGVKYSLRPINLLKSEQTADDYAALNPGRVVPALVIHGHTLVQSVAIMEYLEEAFPGAEGHRLLLPVDLAERALVRAVVQSICADIQPVQNLRVLTYVGDKRNEWANHFIDIGLRAVEILVQKKPGKYCVGDNITMADLCLIPQLYNARRFNVDLSPFPNLVRIEAALSELPEFKDAHPSSQPDCPSDLK